MDQKGEETLELTLFKTPQCYVYSPIPASTTLGHRAGAWDVENWAQETSLLNALSRTRDLWRLDRDKSSDFSAALNEHRQYMRRKAEAKVLREKFACEDREKADYSLKPGTSMTLKLPTRSEREYDRLENPSVSLIAGAKGGMPTLCPPPLASINSTIAGRSSTKSLQPRNEEDSDGNDDWGEFIGS